MIARPALAAVTEALAGVTDPGEAVEILVARDLWPMENAPRVIGLDGNTANFFKRAHVVRSIASIASFGLVRIAAVASLAREALREEGCVAGTVWWDSSLDDGDRPLRMRATQRLLHANGFRSTVHAAGDFRAYALTLLVPPI